MNSHFSHHTAMPVPASDVPSTFYGFHPEYFTHFGLQQMKVEEEAARCFSEKTSRNAVDENVVSKVVNENNEKTLKKGSHICKVCSRILSSASSYYVHMKQHSGHKPYHCTVCPASFCRKPYLEVHMRSHTGEKPFGCDQCPKKFSQKSSLNIHRRLHSGERPYVCEICQKAFAVKSYVDSHRFTHKTDRPLICQHCNLPFTSRAQYLNHVKTHAKCSFVCICGRAFSKATHLLRHGIKIHGLTNFEVRPTTDISLRHLNNEIHGSRAMSVGRDAFNGDDVTAPAVSFPDAISHAYTSSSLSLVNNENKSSNDCKPSSSSSYYR